MEEVKLMYKGLDIDIPNHYVARERRVEKKTVILMLQRDDRHPSTWDSYGCIEQRNFQSPVPV
jgi:hypothetical protein